LVSILAPSTYHHTCIYILCPHASFGSISTLRNSVSGKTPAGGARTVYPP
jgi:hypothetical protein